MAICTHLNRFELCDIDGFRCSFPNPIKCPCAEFDFATCSRCGQKAAVILDNICGSCADDLRQEQLAVAPHNGKLKQVLASLTTSKPCPGESEKDCLLRKGVIRRI